VVRLRQRGRAAAVLVSRGACEGLPATRDELSYPDWARRLARAEREAVGGQRTSLEAYVKRRARR